MVGWNRLLEGRWRDPLVGRDVLIGAVVGVIVALLVQAQVQVPRWLGRATPPPLGIREDLSPHGPAFLIFGMLDTLFSGMGRFFVLAFLIVVLRRVMLGVAAAVVIDIAMALSQGPTAGSAAPAGSPSAITVALQILCTGAAYAVLLRFGYLAFFAGLLFVGLLVNAPLTTDLSVWYASPGAVTGLTLIGLTVYGFVVSLGGRAPFRAALFAE
jgi:serine/threonine-protein kinase